jgi:hypothetical protein
MTHIAEPATNVTNGTSGDAMARTAGRAVFWGKRIVNQETMLVPAEAAQGGNIMALASGLEHVVALTKKGKVLVWAADTPKGQSNTVIPATVKAIGAHAIAAGTFFSVALLRDGTVACWGSEQHQAVSAACKAPALPINGPGAVVKIAAYGDIVVASAQDSRQYVWAVRPNLDTSKHYHKLSQPEGISQVLQGPDSNLLVSDKAGRLVARTDPYLLPWHLQMQSTPVTSVCSGGRKYAAALTSDGRVTVRFWEVCTIGRQHCISE